MVPFNDGKINIDEKGGDEKIDWNRWNKKNMKLREMGQIKLAEVGQV
jgi:hypothetical protein